MSCSIVDEVWDGKETVVKMWIGCRPKTPNGIVELVHYG